MYQVKKVRLFENSRGMIGHTLHIYKGEKEIGESSHDGDSICYDIRFIESTEERDFLAKFGDAQEGVDTLLMKYEDERILCGMTPRIEGE